MCVIIGWSVPPPQGHDGGRIDGSPTGHGPVKSCDYHLNSYRAQLHTEDRISEKMPDVRHVLLLQDDRMVMKFR